MEDFTEEVIEKLVFHNNVDNDSFKEDSDTEPVSKNKIKNNMDIGNCKHREQLDTLTQKFHEHESLRQRRFTNRHFLKQKNIGDRERPFEHLLSTLANVPCRTELDTASHSAGVNGLTD